MTRQNGRARRTLVAATLVLLFTIEPLTEAAAQQLQAGAAKTDITRVEAGPVDGRLHARALVLSDGTSKAVLITLDVVAVGEIGSVNNQFLGRVREAIRKQHGIPPEHIFVNASHCHGIPCTDIAERTIACVAKAVAAMEPVRAGTGTGHEDRIMENRRLKLKNGREIDVRHAYAMPPDEEVAEVGPVDPEIGILRLQRADNSTLAVVYNFACHPIQGVPSRANTADVTGFASEVIEDNLGPDTVALFVQGCGGDINPVFYKDVDHPRGAEPLGNMLGLTTLKALRKIRTQTKARLNVVNEKLELPRADLAARIEAMESEQRALVKSLRGTSLSLKTFLPLVVKYRVSGEFPSYYSHRYLHDRQLGREDLDRLDDENRRNMEQYIRNIHTMEELSRSNINLALLRKHHARNMAAGSRTITVELGGLRVGDFVMTTFPGELTVPVGLRLKEKSPHEMTFIAGYTNGYIYYCPTAEQLRNVGGAQEDSDCLLDPAWHEKYEARALKLLKAL